MLICAPTGAGKTNIALLAILQVISKYMKRYHHPIKPQRRLNREKQIQNRLHRPNESPRQRNGRKLLQASRK